MEFSFRCFSGVSGVGYLDSVELGDEVCAVFRWMGSAEEVGVVRGLRGE